MKTLAGMGMALGLLVAAGCAGDGGSCGVFAACGGDVVGKWSLAQACTAAAATGSDHTCPGATGTSSWQIAGSWTFGADLTYSTDSSMTRSESATFPPSCLTMQGMTVTCAQLDAELKAQIGGSLQSASCSGSSDCTCVVTYKPTAVSEDGTYTTAGNVMTRTRTGSGYGNRVDYCVKGKELDLASDSIVDMGMMGTMKVRSYVIALR